MTGTGTATTLRTKPGPGVHTDVPQRETCRPHLLRCPCARRPSAFSGSSQDPEPCTWQLECPRHNANVGHKGNRGTYDRLTQPHRDSRGSDSSRRWWWSLELRLKKEGQTFFNKRKQQPAAGGGPPHPRGQTQTGGGHTRGAWVGSGHVDPQHSLLLHHEAPSTTRGQSHRGQTGFQGQDSSAGPEAQTLVAPASPRAHADSLGRRPRWAVPTHQCSTQEHSWVTCSWQGGHPD